MLNWVLGPWPVYEVSSDLLGRMVQRFVFPLFLWSFHLLKRFSTSPTLEESQLQSALKPIVCYLEGLRNPSLLSYFCIKTEAEQDSLWFSSDRFFSVANAGNMLENSLLGGSQLKPLKSASSRSIRKKWCRRNHKEDKRERAALSHTQLQN